MCHREGAGASKGEKVLKKIGESDERKIRVFKMEIVDSVRNLPERLAAERREGEVEIKTKRVKKRGR